jgi:DNA-binding response OmpR family regulator
VLLDLLLPKKDGMTVLAELRRVCPSRPVIVLTARGGEEDRVRGLQMGADDYVVKPFSARELLARVEAVLRRTQKPAAEVTPSGSAGGRSTSAGGRSGGRTPSGSTCPRPRPPC